jgi:hypothetical protein
MTCFFDANISRKIVDALQEIDPDVAHHDEHLAEGSDDREILRLLKANDWILISGDDRMRRSPAQKIQVNKSGITAVFLWKKFPQLRRDEQTKWMLRWWPKIAKKARHAAKGTQLNAHGNGEVREVPWAKRVTSHKAK